MTLSGNKKGRNDMKLTVRYQKSHEEQILKHLAKIMPDASRECSCDSDFQGLPAVETTWSNRYKQYAEPRLIEWLEKKQLWEVVSK
jgi:hypothetical protein